MTLEHAFHKMPDGIKILQYHIFEIEVKISNFKANITSTSATKLEKEDKKKYALYLEVKSFLDHSFSFLN